MKEAIVMPSNVHMIIIMLNNIDIPTLLQEQDTPLHSAAAYGHLEAVKVLIQSGAVVSLNMKNKVREH